MKGFLEEDGAFSCPYKCNQKKKDNKNSINSNVRMLNIILRKTPVNLKCDDHTSEDVNAYLRDSKKFICN